MIRINNRALTHILKILPLQSELDGNKFCFPQAMQKERKEPNQPNVHFVDEMGQTDEWRPVEHVQQGLWRIRLLSVQLKRIVHYIDFHAKGVHITTGFSSGLFFSPFVSLA